MSVDLRIAEHDWLKLRKHFGISFRSSGAPETGALAVLGECHTKTKREFIVAAVLLPEPQDLKYAATGALVFDASFIRRAHLAMRKHRLTGIATFHTHPGAAANVGFSLYDDRQDPLLVENLLELEPRTQFVSVVAGKDSQCARFFATPRASHPLDRLVVVGDHLSYLSLAGQPPPPPPPPAAILRHFASPSHSTILNILSPMGCRYLPSRGCPRFSLVEG
jgi:hypothetical protein